MPTTAVGGCDACRASSRVRSLTSILVALCFLSASGPIYAEEDVETITHGSNSNGEASSDGDADDSDSSGDENVDTITHGSDDDSRQTSSEEETGGDGDVEIISHDASSDDEASPGGSSGGEVDFRGSWGTTTGIDTRWQSNEDVVEWSSRVDLGLEYDLSSTSCVVLEGDFQHWVAGQERSEGPNLLVNAADPRASFEARLGESYVLWRSDRWTLRAGHLVTAWGSTSLVRPGDVINPVDGRDLSVMGGGQSRTLPQLAAEVGYVASDWSLEAVVVPFFKPNRLTVFGRDTAIATPQNPLIGDQLPITSLVDRFLDRSRYEEVQPLLQSTSVPDERPKNISAGLRATATAWNTDLGLGYYFGWDRTPFLSIDEDLRSLLGLVAEDGQVLRDFDLTGFFSRNPEALELANNLGETQQQGGSLVSSEYRRRHSLVANVSRYIGPVGVRADVTVSPEKTFVTEELEATRRTAVFGALGLSYERLIDGRPLAITLEGYGLRPLPRESSVNQWFVSDDELGPEGGELALIGEGLYGVAAAVQWRLPIWKLDLQIGGVANVSSGDVILGGRLQRQWRSWLRTGIGGVVYEGPPPEERLSLGGLYDRNDQIQLTVGGDF